jgi:hypothetical protein
MHDDANRRSFESHGASPGSVIIDSAGASLGRTLTVNDARRFARAGVLKLHREEMTLLIRLHPQFRNVIISLNSTSWEPKCHSRGTGPCLPAILSRNARRAVVLLRNTAVNCADSPHPLS